MLDVGCGFGLETERLARLVSPGQPVAGIDASAHFIEEAKRRAAAAGKHVFCEKPFTLTADDARRAIGAAEKAGTVLDTIGKRLGRATSRLGREKAEHNSKRRVGYDYVHSAIDAHSRLAYSEIHDDERGPTCAGFWERAEAFFAEPLEAVR
mgnify:CR=1 FL=1